ncbi:MAG: hypothetical protein RLZ33_2394 [Bacteroidota bacterium]
MILNSTIKFSLLFFFILLNSIGFTQIAQSIPFIWSNDTLNGVYFEKTAMYLPVRFTNDTTNYYFQLDTGSEESYFYSGNWMNQETLRLLNKEDSIQTSIGNLHLAKLESQKMVAENGRMYCGTLGSDFLANKLVEIDFLNQEIHFLKSYSSSEYMLDSLKLSFGRPLITIHTTSKSYDFLFDTGSSLFELWTSQKLWKKLKEPTSEIHQFSISSWGTENTAYRATARSGIACMSFKTLEIQTIWYNSNKQFAKDFKSIDIAGMIGNKPFLNQVVLIDFNNMKIGLKK